MQGNTWESIIQAVSLLASMASLALAIVAIWLSFKFYDMSVHSSEKIEEANRAISASVERLEKIFQMQYSDTFSMVRDTYSDFRKQLLTSSTSAEPSDQVVEGRIDEKFEQIKTEIKSELEKVVDKIGKTDAQLSSVREQIEQVVDKAIVRSREVEKEAREETIKEALVSYFHKHLPKTTWEVNAVVQHFRKRFDLIEIVKALFEMSDEGIIRLDERVKSWTDIWPDTKIEVLTS